MKKYVLQYKTAEDVLEKALAHFRGSRCRWRRLPSPGSLLMYGPFDPPHEGAMAVFTSREAGPINEYPTTESFAAALDGFTTDSADGTHAQLLASLKTDVLSGQVQVPLGLPSVPRRWCTGREGTRRTSHPPRIRGLCVEPGLSVEALRDFRRRRVDGGERGADDLPSRRTVRFGCDMLAPRRPPEYTVRRPRLQDFGERGDRRHPGIVVEGDRASCYVSGEMRHGVFADEGDAPGASKSVDRTGDYRMLLLVAREPCARGLGLPEVASPGSGGQSWPTTSSSHCRHLLDRQRARSPPPLSVCEISVDVGGQDDIPEVRTS
jgi:hypothetical protein